MTDIAGLLRDKNDESTLIPRWKSPRSRGYKSAGIIAGGMIPKIGGMADAIYQGVHEAVIIDGRVPHSILLELFSDRGSGTRFLPPQPSGIRIAESTVGRYNKRAREALRSGGNIMDSEKVIKRDNEYVLHTYGRNLLSSKKAMASMPRAPRARNTLILPAASASYSLGYCDLTWAEAVSEQAHKLQHTSNLYYTAPCGKLAKKLCKRTGMSKVFFGNSGAEANEGAIKAARKYSFDHYGKGRDVVITLVNSFHGRTIATLTATGQEVFHNYFGPFNEGFVYTTAGDIEGLRGTGGPPYLRHYAGADPGRGRRDGAGP